MIAQDGGAKNDSKSGSSKSGNSKLSVAPPRNPVFQDYYTDEDYDQVLSQLPDLVTQAKMNAQEILEPTLTEQQEVHNFIMNYMRKKQIGKIYGGTAMHTILKEKGETIYEECEIADIDFYSPTPVQDLVDLCNTLYENGYKFVQGKEAQHDESFSIFVNMQLYCQISYVPARVYHGIKTIEIDGIRYTHPHFSLIDQLRMFNDPMNSAWRWEKSFKRVYLLLKHYPFEYYDKPLKINNPNKPIDEYVHKMKTEFFMSPDAQKNCLISGFEAYNFFVKHAANDRAVEKMARVTYDTSSNQLLNLISGVPYLEIVSVDYVDTVHKIYDFLLKIVADPKLLSIEEFFPLFQYANHLTVINYGTEPICKIYESDGMCVPHIKTTKGYMYVSYQYLLMFVLICKLRAHLDKNKDMYFNYSIMFSNLIKVRNIFLTENNLGVINKSVFSEFKVSCTGKTISFVRVSQLRRMERLAKGKSAQFIYEPRRFLDKNVEPPKFDPTKHRFSNTSGNKIVNPKHQMFKIDNNNHLINVKDVEEAYVDAAEAKQEADTTVSPSPTVN